MSKQHSNPVREGVVDVRQTVPGESRLTRTNWPTKRHLAGMSASLLAMLLMTSPSAAIGFLPDPVDLPPQGPPSSLDVLDTGMYEGQNGTTVLKFRVVVTPALHVPITVSYTVVDRTAHRSDGDYGVANGVLTIPADGDGLISVQIMGDETYENDETFTVILSDSHNAIIGRGNATGTIYNDDHLGGSAGPRRNPEGSPKNTP